MLLFLEIKVSMDFDDVIAVLEMGELERVWF